MTPSNRLRALPVAALVALACASCAGPPPSTTPTVQRTRLTPAQVLPPLMQCFVDHGLIPLSALDRGKDSNPPSDSSTWIVDGKVVDNTRFGDWFSLNSDVVVNGKPISDWLTGVEANRNTWPTTLCGPMPGTH